MEIVSSIIKENRLVLVEKLLRRASREIKVPKLTLDHLIDELIREKKIIPGSRITREIILNNGNRRKIYTLLKHYPGYPQSPRSPLDFPQ
ncbi:MAG: hypothetical protein ACTSU5_15855 [Promethearchaeota archaeon]